MITKILFALALALALPTLSFAEGQLGFKAINRLAIARPSQTIELTGEALAPLGEKDLNKIHVRDSSGKELLCQAVDTDYDELHKPDIVIFQADFGPNETKTFVVTAGKKNEYTKADFRAYGRFVRERFDDFAWENDLIAHRTYGKSLITWKGEPLTSSAIDIWSKRVSKLVINDWYMVDNYHADAGEGMDDYSAGPTRGCGGSGLWFGNQLLVPTNFVDSRVLANGPIRVMFELVYEPFVVDGAKVSEVLRISLDAGSQLDHFQSFYKAQSETGFSFDEGPARVAVGLKKVKDEQKEFNAGGGWLAIWELMEKNQGMQGVAAIVNPEQFDQQAEDKQNDLLVLKPGSEKAVSYWAGFAWDRAGKITSAAAWTKYVDAFAKGLRSPIEVSVSEKRPAVTRDRIPRRPFEIENLVNEARALPPEFAIDALLRIAASKQVSDPDWKREILEEAFRLASDLQNPLRQRAIYLPATPVDTRSGYRSYAFDLRLDALSVKSRIVAEMLALDRNRALEMLSTVSPKLPLKNLTCADSMVYDVAELYQVLEKVSKTAFKEKQIEQGDRLQLLLPFVENMTWPAQVAPIANLIVSLRLPLKELLPISDAFTGALKKISADDRSFTEALLKDRMLRAVSDLFLFYRQQNLPYKELLDALRDNLTRHLQGPRCQDTYLSDGKEVPSYIRDTSDFLYPNRPLTVDDVRPSELEPGATKTSYYKTLEAAKLMRDYKSLPWDENNKPVTDETKATTEWQQRMLDYLTELEAWKGTSENSEIDYFQQKCVLYFGLARLAPAGVLKEKVISSYLKSLSQGEFQKDNRIEWLMYAHQLFKSINAAEGEEREKLSELLYYSKDAALHLYGGLMRENLL